MRRRLNTLYGRVLSIREDKMDIALPRGGTIPAPITKGIRVGNEVAFLTDIFEKEVILVMLKEEADDIVRRGSNPFYDVMDMEPPPFIEEDNDGDISYETLCGCPDTQ